MKLCWVKAHAVIDGNDRADELAKKAGLKKTVSNYDRCPWSHMKKVIRESTIQVWNKRYTEEQTAGVTKMFFLSAEKAFQLIRKIKLTPTLVQVLTGHGG